MKPGATISILAALLFATLCVPVVAFAADTYEPNNTKETAAAVSVGSTYQSYISTQNDVDYYKVYLKPGNILFRVTPPVGGEMRLEVYDSSSSWDLASTQHSYSTVGQPLEISYSVVTPGYYYLAVKAKYSWYDYSKPYSLRFVSDVIMRPTRTTISTLPATIPYAQKQVLTGTFTSNGKGVGGVKVQPQYSYDKHTWTNQSAVLTGADGSYSFIAYPKRNVHYRARVTGFGSYLGSTSAVTSTLPKVFLSAPKLAATPYAQKSVKVHGFLKPRHKAGEKSIQVKLYRQDASGAWVYKSSFWATNQDYLNSAGEKITRYYGSVTPSSSGKWRARAVHPVDSTNAVTYSAYTYFTVKDVSVGAPVAPATMGRGVAKTVYGFLKPRHTAGTSPVQIHLWKKTSTGTWKKYGYVSAKVKDYSTYSRYYKSMSFPEKGNWRIRAYHPEDSKHRARWSTDYTYVTVN